MTVRLSYYIFKNLIFVWGWTIYYSQWELALVSRFKLLTAPSYVSDWNIKNFCWIFVSYFRWSASVTTKPPQRIGVCLCVCQMIFVVNGRFIRIGKYFRLFWEINPGRMFVFFIPFFIAKPWTVHQQSSSNCSSVAML